MAKYRFSVAERMGLWIAGGKRCFYCDEPLSYSDIWIDHILPEVLLSDKASLTEILHDYGIPEDFEINSFSNWVATHARCNRRKGSALFSKGTTLYNIEIATARRDTAESEAKRIIRNQELERAYSAIQKAIEQGRTTFEQAVDEIRIQFLPRRPEPWVVTFGITTLDTDTPEAYPHLCDRLERDLIDSVAKVIERPFSYSEPSGRTGESLSVRLLFPELDLSELDLIPLNGWEILEVALMSDIYGDGKF